jgi:hypothetical protein
MHLDAVKHRFGYRGIILTLCVFTLLSFLFVTVFNTIFQKTANQEAAFIENTLKRAAITCFAIEGRYPPSLDYLVDHYGIRFSRERYIISYSAFASNILPDIAVLRVGENP